MTNSNLFHLFITTMFNLITPMSGFVVGFIITFSCLVYITKIITKLNTIERNQRVILEKIHNLEIGINLLRPINELQNNQLSELVDSIYKVIDEVSDTNLRTITIKQILTENLNLDARTTDALTKLIARYENLEINNTANTNAGEDS